MRLSLLILSISLLVACNQEPASQQEAATNPSANTNPAATPPSATTTNQPSGDTAAQGQQKFVMPSDLLNHRYNNYLGEMKRLKETEVYQTMAFSKVMDFIQVGGSLDFLAESYEVILDGLLQDMKTAPNEGFKQLQVQLITPMTNLYLDRLVLEQPRQLQDSKISFLSKIAKKLKSNGIDTESIMKSWNGKALQETMTATTADQVIQVFN